MVLLKISLTLRDRAPFRTFLDQRERGLLAPPLPPPPPGLMYFDGPKIFKNNGLKCILSVNRTFKEKL